MGYCIDQSDCEFNVAVEHLEDMLLAIKSIPTNNKWGCDASDCTTIEEALEEWRWELDFDDEGNIIGIQFVGEKAGDDKKLLDAIAPFVVSGSYIQMHGEDGVTWRWTFKDGKFNTVFPDISWAD